MTEDERFSSEISIDPDRLQYEPFADRGQVRRFDSGSPPLDSFLNSNEVAEYERENLGHTTLVFLEGDLVAYYTVSPDGLRLEYISSKKISKSHVKHGKEKVETIPSLKIGRLAVQTPWQSKGLGRILIRRIAASALVTPPSPRLLIVNSKVDSIPFYHKCGFSMTREIGREKRRRDRTMYLDLLAIEAEVRTEDPS